MSKIEGFVFFAAAIEFIIMLSIIIVMMGGITIPGNLEWSIKTNYWLIIAMVAWLPVLAVSLILYLQDALRRS